MMQSITQYKYCINKWVIIPGHILLLSAVILVLTLFLVLLWCPYWDLLCVFSKPGLGFFGNLCLNTSSAGLEPHDLVLYLSWMKRWYSGVVVAESHPHLTLWALTGYTILVWNRFKTLALLFVVYTSTVVYLLIKKYCCRGLFLSGLWHIYSCSYTNVVHLRK